MNKIIIIVTALYALGISVVALLLLQEVERLLGVEEWEKVDRLHD